MWSAIISALVSLIGTGVNYANTQSAENKAEQLNKENTAMTAMQNRFNNSITSRQQDLAENRFGMEKMQAGYNYSKDSLNRLTDLLNNNKGLQNIVLNKWGM